MARINVNPQNPKQKKKFETHNYSNEDAILNLARYVLDEKKTPSHYKNFYGVLDSSPEYIQDSFAVIANLYGKEMKQKRKAEHFILSFCGEKEIEDIGGVENAVAIVEEYCESLAVNHQMFYAMHENKVNLHAHIVINPINYHSGARLHKDREFLNTQRETVDCLVAKYKSKNS